MVYLIYLTPNKKTSINHLSYKCSFNADKNCRKLSALYLHQMIVFEYICGLFRYYSVEEEHFLRRACQVYS